MPLVMAELIGFMSDGSFGGMTGKPRKVCSDFPDIGVVFVDVLMVVFDGFVE